MFKNIPFNRVEWVTSIFLISTAILTVTAVPWYFWTYGWDWFLFGVFLFFYLATGMSITVGYHRLFSHRSLQSQVACKLFVLLLEQLPLRMRLYGGARNIESITNMLIQMMILTILPKAFFGLIWVGLCSN